MEACEFHFWDDLDTPEGEKQTSPHTTGISAIQFILTSNITIHTLEKLRSAYVNIFSCKDFNPHLAKVFTANWFQGEIVKSEVIDRL
jgi:S-adenosylmethionine/arginine decarboxylase-like enzyme